MRQGARTALRAMLDAGPNPYAQLDIRLATRLGGAIWLIAVFYGLVVLPLAPPEPTVLAWSASVAILLAGVATGVWLVRRSDAVDPFVLLLVCHGGVAAALGYRFAVGEGAPFSQFLLLATLYACAIHPARRAFGVVAAATVAALVPAVVGSAPADWLAPTVADIALWWSLGLILVVWGTRTRNLRRELGQARERAEEHARVDALTGLGNRRALEETLARAVAAARRTGRPLCALVGDLDDFKAVNDSRGHAAGDTTLRDVARALRGAVRAADPCFRWGGDEFVVVLPETPLAEAEALAARVTEDVERYAGTGISLGAAELAEHESAEDLLERADAALLSVKDARRLLV